MLLATLQLCLRASLRARGVESRRIATPLGRLHAYDARGSGPLPPVAILHGLGGSAASSARMILTLRRTCRPVLALDLPGHGFSDAPSAALTIDTLEEMVTEALDAALGEPAIVLGNSLGGALGIRYALGRPDRVLALILTSPAGARVDEADLADLRAVFAVDTLDDVRKLVGRLVEPVPWYVPLVAGEIRRAIGGASVQGVLTSLRLEHTFAPHQLAALFEADLGALGKARTRVAPNAPQVLAGPHAAARAHREEPEGFGHSPHVGSPRELAARVVRFAEGL